MKVLTPEQIKSVLKMRQPKDKMRITQGFGGDTARYGIYGHTGVDLGETNRMFGDNLYAPFDGTVYKAKNWAGWRIGWEFYMHSEPMTIDGVNFVIRMGFTHTKGKPRFSDGAKVKKGDIVDTSGGIFILNSFWTGPHTHWSMSVRYDNGSADFINWQPDWNNGHAGYVDPTLYMASPVLNLKDGLSEAQVESILGLIGKKPVSQWSTIDKRNWAYATDNSPLPL